MLILRHGDVLAALDGRETEVIDLIDETYRRFDEGACVVPHSVFLRFPEAPADRIIGLPAYLGGDRPAAGFKWVSSFPGNIGDGLPRASAAIVTNSLATGRPEALLEGSVISARRTAASAALAARTLAGPEAATGVSLIGCGLINFEVLRFLVNALPSLLDVTLYDRDSARAEQFARRVGERAPHLNVDVAADDTSALAAHKLVSFATTAAEPHTDLAACRRGTVVLHVSLRDITADTVLANQNVVDDLDHVCRERTSIHLAAQASGHRDFVDASIGRLLNGTAEVRPDPGRLLIFSPFGLGVLDIALAQFVRDIAERSGLGVHIDGFLPGAEENSKESATWLSATTSS